jgi:hypothetical protein
MSELKETINELSKMIVDTEQNLKRVGFTSEMMRNFMLDLLDLAQF